MPESSRPKGSIKKEGYFSPAPGNLSKGKKEELATIYANVRKENGGGENPKDKEKAAKIAWAAVNKDTIKDALNYFHTKGKL